MSGQHSPETEVDAPGASISSAAPYGGALASIARLHQKRREEKALELMVPGYEGLMRVAYRLRPEPEMDRLLRRTEEVKPGEGIAGAWKVEADTLVALCDKIEVRDSTDDPWQVLEDENGPIRFERHFADLMSRNGVQVNGERAREIVLDFFCPREDPADPTSTRLYQNAMETHVNAIGAWNRNQRDLIAPWLLGE